MAFVKTDEIAVAQDQGNLLAVFTAAHRDGAADDEHLILECFRFRPLVDVDDIFQGQAVNAEPGADPFDQPDVGKA